MEPDSPSKHPERERENESTRLRDDPPHILLAEDDADLRQLVATALRFDGYQVIETRDGLDLIDRISDWMLYRWPYEQLDLIVSDVRMPGLSGTDVVSRVRAARWTTPVILLTAYADPQLDCDRRGLGVTSVFLKPFDIDDLRTAVMNTIAPRHALGDPETSRPRAPSAEWLERERERHPRPTRDSKH